MATELLLLQDMDNLGKAGEVVKVADGYARNYLLPKEIAMPVSQYALRKLEKLRKEREEQARLQLLEAQTKAGKLTSASITIRARTVDGTRLYGSISASDIVSELENSSKISLDRSMVLLEEPLKETGTFDVAVKLHPDVSTTLKVWVVEE